MASAVHSAHPTGKEYVGKPVDSIKKTSPFETKNQLLGKLPEPLKQTAGLLQTRHTGHHASRRRLGFKPILRSSVEEQLDGRCVWGKEGQASSCAGTGGRARPLHPRGNTAPPHPGAAQPPSGGDVGTLGAAVNSEEYFLAGHQTAATGKAAGDFLRSPQTQRSVPAAEARFTGPRSLALQPPGNNTTLEPF